MALIKSVRGVTPIIGEHVFLAENATIIGDVQIGAHSSIWFQAVIRGDVNQIRLGERVNVQDGCVIHATYKKTQTIVGNDVSIGHNAIVHGCQIQDQVLIGMGSIVMDDAVVESNCLIAAGAVVLRGTRCKSGFIYAGVPAKPIKSLTEDLSRFIGTTAEHYMMYAGWYDKTP